MKASTTGLQIVALFTLVVAQITGMLMSSFVAIPFYFIWNWIAPTYFYFIPEVYKQLPFWHVVGLFILIPILKSLINPFKGTLTK